jgi:putative two-component system response regulator
MMSSTDGLAVIRSLREASPPDQYLPMVVLTADVNPETKRQALAAGANDFLTTPFDTIEVGLRIRNLLEIVYLHRQLHGQNVRLEQTIRERTQQLQVAQLEILERLGQAAEFRDDATGEHTMRVGQLAARIAEAMQLPSDQVELLRRAAPLHDIGKIAIPDSILLKPGKLDASELELMRTHTFTGAKMLSGSQFDLLQMAEEVALTHHEHWDGGGYIGFHEEEIPLAGRIVSVADVFDALSHERPYKSAWPKARAIQEIRSQSYHQFDPSVVAAFLQVQREEGYVAAGALG